jgi:hypothetical protein
MPIASLIDTVLSSQSDRLIEPIKKNQYRLLLQVTNLLGVLNSQFGEDADYLEIIKTSMVGNVYPIEVAFTPPAIQVEQRKVRGTGNVEVKYAGYINYGNAEATFYNFIDIDTYKFFYRWAAITGALDLNRRNDEILNITPKQPLSVPDLAADSAGGGYKVNGTLSTYHTLDTAVGDETENNRWILQGVFPTNVSAGDYNHADDGETILTTVSFSIDLALPARPLP